MGAAGGAPSEESEGTGRPPRASSSGDAEIGIQHAYWALLSPNAEERYTAGVRRHDASRPTRATRGTRKRRTKRSSGSSTSTSSPPTAPTSCTASTTAARRRRSSPTRRTVRPSSSTASGASPRPRRASSPPTSVSSPRRSPTSRCNRPTAGARRTARRRSPPLPCRRGPGCDRRSAGCRDRHVADALPGPATPRDRGPGSRGSEVLGPDQVPRDRRARPRGPCAGALQPHRRRHRRAQHSVSGHRQRTARDWRVGRRFAVPVWHRRPRQQGCPEAERGAGTEPAPTRPAPSGLPTSVPGTRP